MERVKYEVVLKQAIEDLANIREDLTTVTKQQAALEKRALELREFIVATSRMLGVEYVDTEELGLTEAIRQIFKSTPTAHFSTGMIEKRLIQIGYDLGKYGSEASATASVSKVISRLAEKREIRSSIRLQDGKQGYQWVDQAPNNALAARVADTQKK